MGTIPHQLGSAGRTQRNLTKLVVRVKLGLQWNNGEKNGNYYDGLYRGYIGTMEKKMETILFRV